MKSYQQRTYYELLDLPVNASADEIRLAYDRSCELDDQACLRRYQLADAGDLPQLRELLREAVEFLTDPELRLEYDHSMRTAQAQASQAEGRVEPAQMSMPDILLRAGGSRPAPEHPSVSYLPRPTLSNGRPPRPRRGDLDHAPVLAEESAIASAEAALASVSARVQQARKPLEISADAEFNGELLRQVRESRGLALQQVSERTRVPVKHLENIEADRYGALPATVYLRGILMSFARELRLDPVRVARSYIAVASEAHQEKER